jgi:hypothetical protein
MSACPPAVAGAEQTELVPVLSHSFETDLQQLPWADDRITGDIEFLPDGLLYRSYLASPHEPRFAEAQLYDRHTNQWSMDATLGGRIGIVSGKSHLNLFEKWQIDLEGAAMPRLNIQQFMDVESIDYRFGLLWTARQQNFSAKFGYYHISSHAGDEYLIKNPGFQRINYVRESLVAGLSTYLHPEVRTYGEAAWAFEHTGGAEPWLFQLGMEYSSERAARPHGAPFCAANVMLRQETSFAPGTTLMTGWQWIGPQSGRSFRMGLQYFQGPTNQFEFLGRTDNLLGAGIWLDY